MKILVGMSGGVDSTIAAYILKKQGHEVVGVNFNFIAKGRTGELCEPNNRKGELCEPNERTGELCEPNDRTGELCEPNGRTGELCEPNKELVEIADKLKIKIISRDFSHEFYEKVITSFVRDHENGITPNPCALCNAVMKFDALLRLMREENATMVATGHYANVVRLDDDKETLIDINELKQRENNETIYSKNTRYCIKKSSNLQKDQSYMLYRLSQDELSHIIFPLANMDKNDVRKIAAELNLKVATKKDSQDVCFINTNIVSDDKLKNDDTALNKKYAEFIKEFELGKNYKERIAKGELSIAEIEKFPFFKSGEFIDESGVVLGYHNGIINYTIGQRKGLNIAFGERKFVKAINVEKNQVVLSSNENLMSSDFKIYDIVFSGKSFDETKGSCSYIAKLRYRHEGTICVLDFNSFDYEMQKKSGANIKNYAICHLKEPVRAITNGQAAVFYDNNDRIMFGGRIFCD